MTRFHILNNTSTTTCKIFVSVLYEISMPHFFMQKKCFLKLQRNYEKNIIVVQNCAMKSAILKIDGRWRWSNAKKWIWRNCSFTTHVGTYSIRKLVIPISRCNFFGMTLCMHILAKNHAHLKATLKWGTRVDGDLFRI